MNPLLTVHNLHVHFKTHNTTIQAVQGVHFHINPGEIVGIVGESGSGKSATAHSLMQLLAKEGRVMAGEVLFQGENLLAKSSKEMERIRGKHMSMVFQDPMAALNPTMRIGQQIIEILVKHASLTYDEAFAKTVHLLEKVGISDSHSRMHQYPHEFSGGMRQRVLISMAIACHPSLIIADEPTTALDMTIQAQILELLKDIQQEYQASILLITHDLGIAARLCDRVLVMYKGQIVESATTEQLFNQPTHTYTQSLLQSKLRVFAPPLCPSTPSKSMDPPLLQVDHLSKSFPVGNRLLQAVDQLSFSIAAGETLGLAGESGCGKSTIGKLLMGLLKPTTGSLIFQGQNMADLKGQDFKNSRKHLQMIFQNPSTSLNPKMTIEQILSEPLEIHGLATGLERRKRLEELLHLINLSPTYLQRLPHELSGGQKQRIGMARALAVQPRLLICDEPLSALDISTQVQIIHLLKTLQTNMQLAYLFISHDLSVMRHLSHRLAIMYLGQFVELAPNPDLYQNPLHPYTQALLSATPTPDPKIEKSRPRMVLSGEIPSPLAPPSGCRFHPRCPFAQPICQTVIPTWQEITPRHFVACHFAKK